VSKVQLKYLLGEKSLGTWTLELSVRQPPASDKDCWPPSLEMLNRDLQDGQDGYLCRKVALGLFDTGIGRYGMFLSYVKHPDVLYLLDLVGDFQTYLKKFSTKSRQNLQRSVKKYLARQAGQPAMEICTDEAQMGHFHREAVAVSRQTYQYKLLKAGLPEDERFLHHIQGLAKQGRARGYLLKDGGKSIAFAWCRLEGERLVYDVVGYLPEHSDLSPGTVLLYQIVQDAFELEGCKLLDFGPGHAQYKSMFATRKEEFIDLYLLRPSIKNRMMLGAHWWLILLSENAGRVLERLGLKQRIKRLMRMLGSH
jgi:CelD/BcsL family acetyltransferase involved in cellulose biosynthesis